MVGLFDGKYFKWIAAFFGFIFTGKIWGGFIAYFLVSFLVSNKRRNLDFEIAWKKLMKE